jgi:hypothetical protein
VAPAAIIQRAWVGVERERDRFLDKRASQTPHVRDGNPVHHPEQQQKVQTEVWT